jgi:glycosyltransferase involved in cell wall biosynthesis/mitochondrial fission protein ELM1
LKPIIWILSDNKAGHLSQTRGLAAALAARLGGCVQEVALADKGFWGKLGAVMQAKKACEGGTPDFILAAGHGTHIPLLFCGSLFPKAKTVVCMKPSLPMRWFDFCIVPRHDLTPEPLASPPAYLIPTIGALHGVRPSPEAPKRHTLILIGGPSKEYGWDEQQVIEQLKTVVQSVGFRVQGSGEEDTQKFLLTTSRRTPAGFVEALRKACPAIEVVPVEETPRGWVATQLAAARAVWVTRDSVSMIYEALGSGAPVGLLEMVPLEAGKMTRVMRGIQMLVDDGWATPFADWKQAGFLKSKGALVEVDRVATILAEAAGVQSSHKKRSVTAMHIVQLIPSLNEGGTERGVVDLNREFVRRGLRNTVISAGGKLVPQIVSQGGTHIICDVKSKNPLTVPLRVLRLRQILREWKPDILHVRSRVPAWLVYFANRSLGIPVVSTVHGFNSVGWYSKIMVRAQHVIGASEAMRSYLNRHYGVTDEIFRLIPRGMDAEGFNPDKVDREWMEAFKVQYGLEGRFVCSIVGRISSLKGIDWAIKALASVSEKLPPWKLLIVGSPQAGQENYAGELKALATTLHLEEQVVFTGSQSKIAEVYACSQVVISATTRKPEAFGRTLVEALAMNCPVIATAHGGALDIVKPGLTGWLVPIENVEALGAAILEASTAKLTGLREYALANFSLEQMVEKTLDVYRECQQVGKC